MLEAFYAQVVNIAILVDQELAYAMLVLMAIPKMDVATAIPNVPQDLSVISQMLTQLVYLVSTSAVFLPQPLTSK